MASSDMSTDPAAAAAAAAEQEFSDFNFESDERWVNFVNTIHISGDDARQTFVTNRLKRRWFKKEVNSNFEVEKKPTESSSRTQDNSANSNNDNSNNNNINDNSSNSNTNSNSTSSSSTSATSNDAPPTSPASASNSPSPPFSSNPSFDLLNIYSLDIIWFWSHILTIAAAGLYVIAQILGFIFPLFYAAVWPSYLACLLCPVVVNLISIHKTFGPFQLSREYIGRAFMCDSGHYLFYSLIFVTYTPHILIMFPLFAYSLIHAFTYLITKMRPDEMATLSVKVIQVFSIFRLSAPFAAGDPTMLRAQAMQLLQIATSIVVQTAAQVEFLSVFFLFLQIFGATGSIVVVLMYILFLQKRYMSSPISRRLGDMIANKADGYAAQFLPSFLSNVYHTIRRALKYGMPEYAPHPHAT